MRLFSLLAYLATAEIIEYEQLDVSSMKTTRVRRDTVDAVESHRNNEFWIKSSFFIIDNARVITGVLYFPFLTLARWVNVSSGIEFNDRTRFDEVEPDERFSVWMNATH